MPKYKYFFSHTMICLMLPVMMMMGVESQAQKFNNYRDSLQYHREHYIRYHEVVKDSNKQWMQFFPIDSAYRITCRFEAMPDSKWFSMKTSGKLAQLYRVYGLLHFAWKHDTLTLEVYQSQSLMASKTYGDYLLIPFTDLTSGNESYASGRYIDAVTGDMAGKYFILDFNKAYNPYCAYSSGFNCPIPPAANALPVSIFAGEKKYAKH